jgi:OHCU decarboxylase
MQPSMMDREAFVARFGSVFEHSPWVAESCFDAGLTPDADTVAGLHRALCQAMRASSTEARDRLITAHPDLAGRLTIAGALTQDSTSEQASAGLDRLTPDEQELFLALNERYKTRFGFPFIVAVRGLTKADVLAGFQARLANDREQERAEALRQIEKIVLNRLNVIFGA